MKAHETILDHLKRYSGLDEYSFHMINTEEFLQEYNKDQTLHQELKNLIGDYDLDINIKVNHINIIRRKKATYVCPYNNNFKTFKDPAEDQFIGDPNGEPFVVQARNGKHWIPISVVIFAKDEDDAINRIKVGLKKIQKQQVEKILNEQKKYHNNDRPLEIGTAQRILETCKFTVAPFDKKYLANAVWASNEYIGN